MQDHPIRRRRFRSRFSTAVGTALAALLLSGAALAAEPFQADPCVASELPAKPGAHWVWVNDFVFQHMADGKAFLVDGDSGRMLGMLSTGFGFSGLLVPRQRQRDPVPRTYFSRGTRGTRTDVVTLYDPRKLSPTGEIAIRRSAQVPCRCSPRAR
jgi:methylamine dehydrogenase heavy chain